MSGWLGTIALDTSLSHECLHSLVPRLLPSVGRRLLIGLWEWFFNNVHCVFIHIAFTDSTKVLGQNYKFTKEVTPNSLCICVDMRHKQPVDSKSFSGLTS